MKQIAAILNKLLIIAKDAKVWLRVLVLVVTLFAGAIIFSRTKVKKEDCTYYIEQNKQLVNALIDIKRDLSVAVSTSFTGEETGLIFAQNVPKQKSQYQQNQQIKKVMSKIDSVLLKYRLDSLKRIKSKT